MKNTSSFEDFIRQKLDEGQFAFEEQHWDVARRRIAELRAAEKKRRRRFVFWIFGAVLLLGLGAAGTWQWQVSGGKGSGSLDALPSEVRPAGAAMETDAPHVQASPTAGGEPTTEKGRRPANLKDGTPFSSDPKTAHSSKTTRGKKAVGKSATRGDLAGKASTLAVVQEDEPLVQAAKLKETILAMPSRPLEKEEFARELPLLEPLPQLAAVALASDEDPGLTGKLSEVKIKRPSPWGLAASLHFGTGTPFSPALKDMHSAEANLHLTYRLAPRWQASTGIGYTFVNGRVPVASRLQTAYAFVATTTRYEWSLKTVHFLHLPLQLDYMAGRHVVSLGGDGFFRLKTAGDLTVLRRSTLESEQTVSAAKDVDFGAALPFLNTQLSLGYGFRFNAKMMAGVQYRQGFQDLLADDFFNKQQKDRASFAGLFLKYKI